MNIKKIIDQKKVTIASNDFNTGKIVRFPGRDILFLFDLSRNEIAQLSEDFQVIHRIPLNNLVQIKRIDTAFFDTKDGSITDKSHGFLIVTDFLSQKMFRFNVEFNPDNTAHLTFRDYYSMKTGSLCAAGIATEDKYILLDKGASMIRMISRDFSSETTVGSRMGYIYEYDDEEKMRLGFEFPEDMAISGNRTVVSDSGNKRLVILDGNMKLEKVIRLPEYPFKILAWDQEEDRLIVSDFDRSIMIVSLRYGFISQEELEAPVDFFPSTFDPKRHIVGSEQVNGCELIELYFPDDSIKLYAQAADHYGVSMRILWDEGNTVEARNLVNSHPGLLPEYVKYTVDTDESILNRLTDYIKQTFHSTIEENERFRQDISKLSLDFIKKYISIPECDDLEAANIDKENIRHRMFGIIKCYRKNLKSLKDLSGILEHYPSHRVLLNSMLDTRFEVVKSGITESIKHIDENLQVFNEAHLLGFIVDYWFFSEEEQNLFNLRGNRENRFSYEKLFGRTFLLAILNDFYSNIAGLFRKRGKIEQYISFMDREITMYPDKMGIFTNFCSTLISIGKYDDVLRMLKKFPDQNKENVNYFHYRVCLGKGEKEQAFRYLKKELELYSHRTDLIPEIIDLGVMNGNEAQTFIDKILQGSAQTIDINFHAAKSLRNLGDFEKAEYYIDRELELFPENSQAVALKNELFLKKYYGTSITSDIPGLRKTWNIFNAFLKGNRDEVLANRMISFFLIFNYIDLMAFDNFENEELKTIIGLRNSIPFDSYREELNIWLSFLKHYRGIDIPATFEKYEKHNHKTYLSAYSTQTLAFDCFFEEAKQLKSEGKWEAMFERVEEILTYNPGNPEVFGFLDSLTDGESVA